MCSSPDAIYMSIQRPKWYLKIVTGKLRGYRSVPADDTHAHNQKWFFFITYPYLLTQYGFDLLSARSTLYEGKNGWGELGHDVMQNKLLTAFIHVSQCRHRVWKSVHAQNNRSHFSKLTLLLFLAVNRAQSWKACSNYELSEQNKTENKRKKKSLSDLPLGLSRWHHKGERQPLERKKKSTALFENVCR